MESSLPLVAIVTPVYNGAPWLERTMACVQNQTYGNLVHVVLDNASTDDTPDVIARYRNMAKPLKTARNAAVLSQTANWNEAMRLTPAEAKYVMLLCADDLIRADAIEKLVARAEEDESIVLVTAADVVLDHVRAPLPPEGKTIVDGKAVIKSVLDHSYNHFAWQLFFARWRPEDGEQDYFSYTATSLDNDKLLRLMMTGKVGFVMEPLFYTRTHSANMSAQLSANHSPKFRLFRWETATRYAPLLLDPAKARTTLFLEKLGVLRFELAWRLTGAKEPADALKNRLAADGHPPNWWDYIAAAASYPIYKIRQKRISAKANSRWPGEIREDEFILGFTPAHHASNRPAQTGKFENRETRSSS